MGIEWSQFIPPCIVVFVSGIASFIKTATEYVVDKVTEWTHYQVFFDIEKNPRCKLAIFEEIRSRGLLNVRGKIEIEDNGCADPGLVVQEGIYCWKDDTAGYIKVEVTKTRIIARAISVPWFRTITSGEELNEAVANIYKKHNQSDCISMFYGIDKGKWMPTKIRPPRKFDKLKTTVDMDKVMQDVKQFKESSAEYEAKGYIHKRCYLLYGPPGTGKSTIPEMIMEKYGGALYNICLNSSGMDDGTLVNLISQVPSNSIIMFDEMEKQWDAIQHNKRVNVTMGGILSAIDGPQRLSQGTIVIMTCNDISVFKNDHFSQLTRSGRMEKFQMKEKLDQDMMDIVMKEGKKNE